MPSLEHLVVSAGALLIDFDGPLTRLMPPPLNRHAANVARASLSAALLPRAVAETSDHLEVLRWSQTYAATQVAEDERACTEAEVACAGKSEPNEAMIGIVRRARSRGVRTAVVSNNSERAVRAFLERFALSDAVDVFACRTLDSIAQLKPDAFLVNKALNELQTAADDAIFIGDSVSDVEAGRSANVRVIGIAKDQLRFDALANAGASAVFGLDVSGE